MRAATLLLTALFVTAPVLAQEASDAASPSSTTQPEAAPTPETAKQGDRHNQRIERIQHEDGGSRVDELRVGGETKNITVQPKVGNLPSYEVQPQNIEGADGTNGRRVWRAIQF